TGAAQLGPSDIMTLVGGWPPVIAHDPRMAVLETARGGVVRGGEMIFAMTPLELDGDPTTNDMIEGGLSVDVTFDGATFVTPELPLAVQRASGALRMRDKALSVRLDQAMVAVEDAEPIRVTSGAMNIRTLAEQPIRAALNATVEAPVSTVVVLANRFEVPELKGTPLGPDDVEGDVRATVSLRTPLGDYVPDSAREWSIEARLINAAAKIPVAGQTFSNANVEVMVNRRRLAARGRAEIDGLAVDVNYSEFFDGAKSGGARFVLTDKDRIARGFDTGDMVKGPVVVTLDTGTGGAYSLHADLTGAAVSLPFFKKDAGKALSASGDVVGEPANLTLSNVRVEGDGGVDILGDLAIQDGALSAAAFAEIALSDGDDARLSVSPAGEGYRAAFSASRFDARPLIQSLKPGGSTGRPSGGKSPMPSVPLTVEADAAKVRLNDGNELTDLDAFAQHDGKKLQRLSVTGRLNNVNAGSFVVTLKPAENNTRRLQADITALGRALSALDIYTRMRGGRTIVDARLDADGVLSGKLTTTDFVITGERTLEDILQQTAATTAAGRYRDDQGLTTRPSSAVDGMSFDRLTIAFTKRGDVLRIDEAILRGPILGGTANGSINLRSGEVSINGTLIPAYGVNNLFGRLPVFGTILGGSSKEGLIGVTFRLAGPLDGPQIIINPMSAIAPGIFRRIFEFR
ncbi:MAG: AsmA-like C-terminal domain-containing protein, partial [Pseudomonadota bacterium]